MIRCLDVAVPGPWWNSLTYAFDGVPPLAGARVKVPLGRGERVGFIVGLRDLPEAKTPSLNLDSEAFGKLKSVKDVIDETPVLGEELWNLAGWIGKTFLCGMGEALQVVCPAPILRGEPFSFSKPAPADDEKEEKNIKEEKNMKEEKNAKEGKEEKKGNGACEEILFYRPLDEERFAYYRERLSNSGRVLLLFPEAKESEAFFMRLPKTVKEDALLWPSTDGKKLWDAWRKTASGETRIVIGAGSAVFAPFPFDEFIVEDESNPAYLFRRAPRLSARSLAGRRAMFLKARLVLGGRMPSAKTFLRSSPQSAPCLLPDRKNLVFVDMKRSFKTAVRGIEGQVPITKALIEHTQTTLNQGRHVFWIMDRKGQAGEVYCSDCGDTLYCSRCGSIMRTESENTHKRLLNTILRCVRCGLREALPLHCPACRGTFLSGKRPGLEELLPLAARYIKGYDVLLGAKTKPAAPSVILGTRGLLSQCAPLDAGLVAWLDLDAETRKAEYNTRFQAFSMMWESYWRGLREGQARVVLMQTRCPGSAWQRSFWLGWEYFWKNELQERKRLNLPPHALLIQVDLPEGKAKSNNKYNNKNKENVNGGGMDRNALTQLLEKANFFVMDSGDEQSPLWITAKTTDRLAEALASRFEIRHSRLGFPVATVWTE